MLILNENHPQRKGLERFTEVITPSQAQKADIRALRLGVLNLMPFMDETERDILQSIGYSVLQIEPIWIKITSLKKTGRHTPLNYVDAFYLTMEEATKQKNLDGLIVTGAPIELLDFEEVEYWKEMEKIFDYARKNIYSSMFLCWAAMAAAYHHYGIGKVAYPKKLSGIFRMNNVQQDRHPLTMGMNPEIWVCQSRQTDVDQEALQNLDSRNKIVRLLESSEQPIALNRRKIGITTFASVGLEEVYNLGHFEYHENTIDQEVKRDKGNSSERNYPIENYYANPDLQEGTPKIFWKSDRTLFYGNFLNVIYHRINQDKKRHQGFSL